MATAEQMRRLHPDPPNRRDDYQQAVRDALAWRLDFDDYRTCGKPDLTHVVALLARADRVITALLRHGTPGAPQ